MYLNISHIPTKQTPYSTWLESGLYLKLRDFDSWRTIIQTGSTITVIDNMYTVEENK